MNIRNYLKGIGVGIIVASLVLIIAGKFNNKAMTDDDVIKRAKELGMVESTTLTQPSANNGLVTNDSNDRAIADDKESNVADQSGAGGDTNADDANAADADKNTTANSTDANSTTDKNQTASEADKNTTDANNSSDKNQSSTDNNNTGKGTDTNTTNNQTGSDTDKNSTATDSNSSTDKNQTGAGSDKTVKSSETVSVEVKSGMSSESAAAAAKDAGLVDDDIEFNKYLCANGYDKRLRVGQYDIPKGSDFETIAKYLCGEQ